MKNRTLVCVLAETRAHKLTWKSFKQHCLDALNADLAVCVEVGDHYDYNNPYWQHARYRWSTRPYADWGVAYDTVQDELRAGAAPPDNWRDILQVKDQWLGGVRGEGQHKGSAGILIYFRKYLFDRLREENLLDRYDRIIVTRSDFVWAAPHPPLKLLKPGSVWFPDGEGYGGLTDRHAVLDASTAEPYLTLINPIVSDTNALIRRMQHRADWNLEKFIQLRLSDANIQVNSFPYPAYSVREWAGSTSWSAGAWNDQLGCYIKYESERAEANKIAAVFDAGFGWQDVLSGRYLEQGKAAVNAFLIDRSGNYISINGIRMMPHLLTDDPAALAMVSFSGTSGRLGFRRNLHCDVEIPVDSDITIGRVDGGYVFQAAADGSYYGIYNGSFCKTNTVHEGCIFGLVPRYQYESSGI